jgi:hypothetical protein
MASQRSAPVVNQMNPVLAAVLKRMDMKAIIELRRVTVDKLRLIDAELGRRTGVHN